MRADSPAQVIELFTEALNGGDVEAAVRLTGAPMVDVSSGVESKPGIKDPDKLEAFFAAVRRLAAASHEDLNR